MNRPLIKIEPPSDHFSEILLLAIIACGCIYLAAQAIDSDKAGEASAWTAVLMAIISAIKERWTQRSVDRMGQSLANAPPADPPAEEPKP
jgi:nitrate reductase gamma subunit